LAERIPDWTPYNYVRNDPVRLTDPDGRADDKDRKTNPHANRTVNRLHVTNSEPTVSRTRTTISVSGKDSWGLSTKNVSIKSSASNISNVSNKSAVIVSRSMKDVGETKVQITSTVRTPEKQASVMYDNIQNSSIDNQKALYGPSGDKVIDTYSSALSEKGSTPASVKSAMTEMINELGPQKVSAHCGDPSIINIIDIAPSSVSNVANFQSALKSNPGVSKLIPYPKDPAIHIEIKQ
jgi:hypothetical protein